MEKVPKKLSAEEQDRVLKEYDQNLIEGFDGNYEAVAIAEQLREDIIEPVSIKASRRLVVSNTSG